MDPVTLSDRIKTRYQHYLQTTFYFKDPELRASFEEALKSGHLSRGPFLEATPVFKRGQSPRTLFQSLLGFQPDLAFLSATCGDRPLYEHQERAIRRVYEDRNVIVATGTGSGKTEAFLYPILLHLYQEFQTGKLCPGVRALILYPMNALANDQRERLGEICKLLEDGNSSFRFTFGQYTGETPEDEHDTQRHARDHISERLPGELVLRSEMRTKPPHILLTNYSMLEYLLLRPNDSPLFDNGRSQWWRFLVLDEVHQYRGSRGIEMAMLLRRLKRRLIEGGCSASFRCIATSATLMGGGEDRKRVARFAADLFNEEFSPEDVILGESEPVPAPGPKKLTAEDYRLLKSLLYSQAPASKTLDELAEKLDVLLPANEEVSKAIGRILLRDCRAANLRQLITGQPGEVKEIAAKVFDDLQSNEQEAALSELVDVLLKAQDPNSGAPLLSARYHLFIRSLEGAFVSYWPQKKVFLERKVQDVDGAAFEVALCRECGQHYLVGSRDFRSGRLTEAIRDASLANFGATFFRPVDNGHEEDDKNAGEELNKHLFQLCVQCGACWQDKPRCPHQNSIRVVKEDPPGDEDRADQIARCGACGYNAAGRDPVQEVIHGTDGPNAVIATTLYQSLPNNRNKILAFADGRQEAAFFAWYLENSYKDILSRNLILKVVQKLSAHTQEGLSLGELATGMRALFREKGILPPATGDLELYREAWLRLYRELLTNEPRISLEGVGLVKWLIKWPRWFKAPEIFTNPPWSLTEPEAWDLLFVLLDSMRSDKAIELRAPTGVQLSWGDLDLQASQVRVRIGSPRRPKGVKNWPVRSWDSKHGKRARFLTRLLMTMSSPEQKANEQAVIALRAVWESIRQFDEDAPSSSDRLLFAADDARRLNPDWWRLRAITKEDKLFQCNVCGRLQAYSIRGVCPRHRCPGTLKVVSQHDTTSNHYRLLYEEELPGVLRVEEHTAQLDHEKAREFQREFRKGSIHVLSCSTTFELGVDLGDLDSILLRNVPPEAYNYAQRVGRVGRRSGYPGFAITYCRRSPHDLYHFSEPGRMLSGRVQPPVLSLSNDKIITRHMTAAALSVFFRQFSERFSSVESLIRDWVRPSALDDFRTFLRRNQAELEISLNAIIPTGTRTEAGLTDGTWITKVAGDDSQFSLAEAEVVSDYLRVKEVEQRSASHGNYDDAKWARLRANGIATEDVLSFLSRKAVIPKYGFPVDIVELDTQRTQQNHEASEVLLQRDLSIAIAEFAPTSKLVANKKMWTSYGLKRVTGKEWDQWWYARCQTHNRFARRPFKKEEQAPPFERCCDHMVFARYIDPRFGFVTSRGKPEVPKARPPRVFTTRPYFAGFKGRQGDNIDFEVINLTTASPGYMVVLCEGRWGQGFYICGVCGFGDRRRLPVHKTPHGQSCHGTLERVSLGHEYITDVVQLQFHPVPRSVVEPIWFAHSLAYALVEGTAEVLEVPSIDLNATVAHGRHGYLVPPIILYDNVPGGAGLVARLEEKEILEMCLRSAQKRVCGNCGCSENTSCYACLRSYRNQFAHQYLQRGAVKSYLEVVLSKWK